MNYELDGVCVHCQMPTPVSENTLLPEGIVCSMCREDMPDPDAIHIERLRRLEELEVERLRLMTAVQGREKKPAARSSCAPQTMTSRFGPILN